MTDRDLAGFLWKFENKLLTVTKYGFLVRLVIVQYI